MSNEEILREYRDDSKFPYLSQVIYTVNDCFDMLYAARKDEALRFVRWKDNFIEHEKGRVSDIQYGLPERKAEFIRLKLMTNNYEQLYQLFKQQYNG